MFKYKVIVLSRKFQLYTYNWNWWRKIHSCMPLNFFSVYLLKKTVFEEIKISGSFSSFVSYIWKLASLKIFHLQKALLLDTTQKQKRKKQLIVLQIWTTPKKIHSNDKFWLNIAMMLFRENSRTSFPASLNCLEKETLSKNFLNFARKVYTH